MRHIRAILTGVVLGALAAGGCEKEPEVVSSKQAKDSGTAVAPAAPAKEEAATPRLNWKLPEGWQEDPTPRQMREATIIAEAGDPRTEVIVTRLYGNFGEIADNINRWRGQVGLEPLADTSAVQPRTMNTPAGEARILKIEGPDKASVISMVKRGDETWFFRLTGPKAGVAKNEAKMDQFLQSLSGQ